MRIFLIWAGRAEELRYLVSELKKKSHEVVYWVGIADGKEGEIPGAVFHEHNAAWSGVPANGIDMSEFPPPGKDLIEKLYETESLILTMLNKRFGDLCIDEKKRMYYSMLRYWLGIINKYKPDAIIFPTIPHTVYNYIIYTLAKMLNIKTIMFEYTNIFDRLLLYEDWEEGGIKLQDRIQNNQNKNFSIKDLSPDIQRYYELQTNYKKDATPTYAKYYKSENSGFRLVKRKLKVTADSIKDGTIFKKAPRFIINRFKSNLKKDYFKLQVRPNLERKFIYVPLNFQPERTTSPQGDMFYDQILMIENLAYSLPKDWVIYVKEHPSQWIFKSKTNYSNFRYKGYYEKIAKLENVFLIPTDTDTYTLINKSRAVATVAGTAGWEAILRRKPVLIFGYVWYRDCPYLFKVNDVRSCQEAFKEITGNFRIEEQKIINYLKSFDEATTHGYFEEIDAPDSKLTKEENKKGITQAILNELEKQNN